ncbi:MAG: hypothetical protein ACT4RN_01110 [Pseudonocardia sp.]
MGPIAETWTGAQCAQAWGVRPGTWLSYVSRGQAPAALPATGAAGRRLWDADEVRAFPRPGAGRSRAGAGPEADALLADMRAAAAELAALRDRQRELLRAGRERGLDVVPMARALGISRQTATAWLAAP